MSSLFAKARDVRIGRCAIERVINNPLPIRDGRR
jgi:hypothetical protein